MKNRARVIPRDMRHLWAVIATFSVYSTRRARLLTGRNRGRRFDSRHPSRSNLIVSNILGLSGDGHSGSFRLPYLHPDLRFPSHMFELPIHHLVKKGEKALVGWDLVGAS